MPGIESTLKYNSPNANDFRRLFPTSSSTEHSGQRHNKAKNNHSKQYQRRYSSSHNFILQFQMWYIHIPDYLAAGWLKGPTYSKLLAFTFMVPSPAIEIS